MSTAGANTWSLLQAPQLAAVHHLATTLLDDLAALDQECLLVLADYDFAQAAINSP